MNKKRISRFSGKTDGLLNFADLKKTKYKVLYWFMFACLILLSLICLLPVIWVALAGFKTPSEMYAVPPTFFPKHIDLSQIVYVWNKSGMVKYFKASLIIIIGCLAFDIIVNGLAGYALSRIRPMGSKILDTLIFWSMLLPGISMVPLFMTFVDLPILHINLTGSYLPLWMMAGANAFNVLLFRNFFNGIPISYVEAARIDGCTDLGIFARIILPLSKPIIMVVSIFSITGSWSSFLWPYLLLGNTNKEPVATMLYRVSQSTNLMQNEYMLLLMLSIIPVMIMYALFSKQIMGGLDIGGIKG